MATILGNQGTSFILQSIEKERGKDGTMVREVYRCDKDSVGSLIGGFSFGQAHGDHPLSFLRKVTETQEGKFATVVFSYEPKLEGSDPVEVDDEAYGASTSASEVPIDQHASYSETWKDSKSGVDTYFIAQSTFTRTVVLDSNDWDWTEANLVSGMNQRGAPTGLSSATANNWLKISREPSQSGETVTLTEEWLHNPDGWDTDIYS